MNNWLNRTELLIGKDSITKLQNSKVAIFGVGGVGSYVAESLIRAGIGTIYLIDNDIIDISNINRQSIANVDTIGKPKVEVAKHQLLKINPNLKIKIFQKFYDESKNDILILPEYDYIADCIDSVKSKISLIVNSKAKDINIISAMGAGNKLDNTKFEVTDIYKTSVCPLAKVIRKELKLKNVDSLKVVYSKAEPIKINSWTPGSISFVPSCMGLIMAGEIVKDLIKN